MTMVVVVMVFKWAGLLGGWAACLEPEDFTGMKSPH